MRQRIRLGKGSCSTCLPHLFSDARHFGRFGKIVCEGFDTAYGQGNANGRFENDDN